MTQLTAGPGLQPTRTGTVAIFQSSATALTGTASALTDRFHPALERTARVSQETARMVSFFLGPAALLAFVFGFWRLGVDLEWTGNFPISRGLLSHWMVWFAVGVGLQGLGSLLEKPRPATPADSRPDPAAR